MKSFSLRYFAILSTALLFSGNTFAAGKVVFENLGNTFEVKARCGYHNHQTTLNNGDSLQCSGGGNYAWVDGTSYGPYSFDDENCGSTQDFKFTVTRYVRARCMTSY